MKHLFITLLLFISLPAIARTQQQDTIFHLEIHQVISPGFHSCNFVVAGGKLRIYQHVYNKRLHKFQPKKVYTTTISNELENEIINTCAKLYSLEDSYIKPILDGSSWDITIIRNNRSKRVKIDNYEVKEVDALFSHINTAIKKGKPKLSLTK
ncbi:MAG: hypothetical protein R2800_08700 [Flavipsychrobacter sp.]